MEVFPWNAGLVTKLGPIDRQHRQLVALINKVGAAVATGSPIDAKALSRIFGRLREHARVHFAEEEQLMLNAGVDGRHQELHRQAHAVFTEQLASLWDSRLSIPHPSETILEFLSQWLVQHIIGIDMAMVRQIELLRQGVSAAQAYELVSTVDNPSTAAMLGALRNLLHTLSNLNRDLGVCVRDRTEELQKARLANRQLEARAHTDGLLGIANRASFDERLAQEWARALRERLPLSLLMIDVDHFKLYNDAYGHQAGDSCLQRIARAVAAQLRRPGDFVARYGGEEFAVILPNTDLEGARSCAEQIRERVASLDLAHGGPGGASHVTVSIGAASCVPRRGGAAALLAQADRALYRAKSEGRNCVWDSRAPLQPGFPGHRGADVSSLPR
jgi:diguanylate cyclase (GGDEF)-like protein/hemerythrin-like metal-binding protein